MQLLIDSIGNIIQVMIIGSILFYAPFAKDRNRALRFVLNISVIWGGLRIFAMMLFPDEGDMPLIAFLILPFVAVFWAIVFRTLKFLLFKIPLLAKWEEETFSWIKKKGEEKGTGTIKDSN